MICKCDFLYCCIQHLKFKPLLFIPGDISGISSVRYINYENKNFLKSDGACLKRFGKALRCKIGETDWVKTKT